VSSMTVISTVIALLSLMGTGIPFFVELAVFQPWGWDCPPSLGTSFSPSSCPLSKAPGKKEHG